MQRLIQFIRSLFGIDMHIKSNLNIVTRWYPHTR